MKIIRLTTLLDFGGQERQYISFVEDGMSDIENEYIFAAIGYGGYAENYIRERGFEVKIFNSKPNILNIINIWILFKWFQKIKPDIVHTAAAEANFHGVIAAKLARIKVVIAEEIGIPNHSNKAKFIFKYIYKLSTKVICVSESVKDNLIRIKEIENKKGVVIYNPVSASKLVERKLKNEFTIVTVGRLEKVKNQQLLVKTISKINDKSVKLIIVGDGKERLMLEQLILELKLENRVTITGFVPNPEYYLSQCHLFVLPSLSEGFGIAVVEAMQQQVPCLCSNVGGIPEFINENETGWLFNPKSESELLEKLNKIIATDYDIINKIGINGQNYVDKRFTTKKYKHNLENLYKKYYD
ncbi:glycosyltransferase family 4 protein [Flavobacterium sp. XS2P12]|uniref:glycosyltransferase family 4 protein n=1 Tax=Flavobacterium melibiosi TaxID=3398734 RepID=UPI003A885B2E